MASPNSTDWTCPFDGHVAVGESTSTIRPKVDASLAVRVAAACSGFGSNAWTLSAREGRSWGERLTSEAVKWWTPQHLGHDIAYSLTERDILDALHLLGMSQDRYSDLFREWLEGDGWQVGSFADFLAETADEEQRKRDGAFLRSIPDEGETL